MSNTYSFDTKPTKRISFLIATKDRAKFLDKALKVHKKLLSSKDELIVIDGASTDSTLQVLNKHQKNISIAISEPDISEGHAFNKGILLSKGKYIKILTDDDVFYKDAIEQAVKIMEEHPEIDVLLCGGVKTKGKGITLAYAPPGSNYGKSVSDVFTYGGCGLGMLIRKSAFAKTELFTPKALSLDNEYLAKAIASGAVVKFCRINMYHHFLEEHSAGVSKWNRLVADVERIKKKYNVKDPLFQRIRKKLAPALFPLLPEFIKSRYITFMKKYQKPRVKYKPIWDGGFS